MKTTPLQKKEVKTEFPTIDKMSIKKNNLQRHIAEEVKASNYTKLASDLIARGRRLSALLEMLRIAYKETKDPEIARV
jgi:hypothetical protein